MPLMMGSGSSSGSGSGSLYPPGGGAIGGQMSPYDAWNILSQPGNVYDQMSLGNILTSIGISSGSDLALCQPHEIMSIAQTLSPLARISFLRMFGMAS
jgi:hypothetical protein